MTDPRSILRWGALLTVVFLAMHIPRVVDRFERNSWLFRDNAFYFTTTVALAEHGRIEQKDLQPVSWYEQHLGWNDTLPEDWSNVSLGRNGGYYPKHPIVLPVLAVPFYWIFGTIGTLFVNVLINLAFIWLVFLLARHVVRIEVAALLAAAVAWVPFVRDMSYSFSNDALGADLVLASLELALSARFGWAGVCAGLAIWSRVTNAAFLPGLAVAGWDRGGLKAVGRAALFSLIPLGTYSLLNTWCYGAPWITSYQRVLVRQGGHEAVATHSDLFNVPWERGWRSAILGPEGAFATFPLLWPAVFTLPLVVIRRWKLAIALILFCTLPTLLLMRYDFFRPHFLYAIFGASMLGPGAALQLILPKPKPAETPPPRLRWQVPTAAGLAVVVVGGLIFRLATRPDPKLLSTHMHDAQVFVGMVPCDFWSPQDERWECSHLDHGGAEMAGRITRTPAKVELQPRRGIWLPPSTSGKWRRIDFPVLDGTTVKITAALTDDSWPGEVDLVVQPRGNPPVALSLTQPGQELTQEVQIGVGPGPELELRIRADMPATKHVVLDGVLSG